MNEKDIIKRIGLLIAKNKTGVIYLLYKNNININTNANNYDISFAIINALKSGNIEFAKDLYKMMYLSNYSNYGENSDESSGSDTVAIIKGATTIVGMFTDMWGKTNTNTNSTALQIANVAAQTEIKTSFSTIQIIGIVSASVILLGIVTIVVVKMTK